MNTKEIDTARAFLYDILALFFVENHTKQSVDKTIKNLKILCENEFDADMTKASKEILELIETNSEALFDEYQKLFLIPFDEYISLSASWYHEEREGGAMLLAVREVLAKTKIRRDEELFKAPEDHYGFIFSLSNHLIANSESQKGYGDLQKELFVKVLNPYIEQLYFRLLGCSTKIYPNVAVLVGSFMGFERSYLNI